MKALALIGVMVLLHSGASQGRQQLTVGQDGQISWEGAVEAGAAVQTIEPEYRSTLDPNITELGVAPVNLVDFANADFPASILPRRVQEGQNLAAEIAERGGSIRAPTVFDLPESQLQNILAQIVSPDPTGIAFERKGRDVHGTLLVLDLGARFGVNQIRFFPRNTVFPSPSTPFQEDFLKNFEVHVNDGQVLTEAGNPIWETFAVRTNNTAPVSTIAISPPRFLRFIRLRAASAIPFEVEKFQVFGEGFFPTVQYISPIIDMGTPANWGRLRWLEETVGQASAVQMHIRTRSGRDPSPFAYTRKRVGRQDAEEIALSVDNLDEPLLRDEYLDLPARGGPSDVWERGAVRDDLANWSPWTSPYNPAAGTSREGALVLSPGPRRYFQFQVDFLSDDLEAAKILRQFSFDFTTPPLADALVGEVFPREVLAAADIPFVYAVRAEMESGALQGFDGFELVTGSRIDRIERIEIIDAQGEFVLAHDFAVQDAVADEGDVAITEIAEHNFAVRFPRVAAHNTVLKIHFVSRILSYSTAFEGRGLLLQEDAFQGVQAGDATALDEGDISFKSGTIVLSPAVNSGSLVGSFDLAVPVITPNGDGVNDVLDMECEVLAVGGGAQIAVDIYDLGGRRVRRLFNIEGQSGVYGSEDLPQLRWDGTDNRGENVAPGLYLVQLNIEGDARASASTRTVGVAY